jgi:two-component system cell cycle response regulator
MQEPDRSSPAPLVLVANDQEWSARSLESILGPQGYAVVRAHTGRQALELARRTRPDAIIVDSGMPDIPGMEVCRILREDARFSDGTPIIVTTAGPASRTERMEAYRAGAWEFVSQPLDSEAFLLQLENFIRSKRELDRSRDDSLLDATTGLYNVRGLARRAKELGADASRRRAPLACVAVAPLAGNDEQENATSDEQGFLVITHLSDIFRRTARMSDVVGHLGRSEFAILAPATEAKGIVRLFERIQETIDSLPLDLDAGGRKLKVRAGYCAVPDFAESSVDAVELLLRAATALRHVKSGDGDAGITAFEDVPVKFLH